MRSSAREVFEAKSGQQWPPWLRVFLLVLAVYAVPAVFKQNDFNAHTQLAWAILNGSFSLQPPYGTTELLRDSHGRVFVAYGPTAAFLLMPFVALFGRELHQTSVSAIFGAAAVALWFSHLGRKGVSDRSRKWLTTLFAVGTPFAYYAAENGNNWSITTSTAILCVVASVFLSGRGNYGWAGVFMGLAILSRNLVACLTPVVVLLTLAPEAKSWRALRFTPGKLAVFGMGMAIALSLGAYYNWERFGSPIENGYSHIHRNDPTSDFGRRPAFAFEYAHHNVPFYLFTPPVTQPRFPWFGPDVMGMSMILSMPALLLVPFANWRVPLNQVALICIVVIQGFYFVFIGDGRGQFGMRYAMDYFPAVMLILASITGQRFGRTALVLTIGGIVVEIWAFVTWRALGW